MNERERMIDAAIDAIGVKVVAELFGEAFERLISTPEGEDKLIAYLERKAGLERSATC